MSCQSRAAIIAAAIFAVPQLALAGPMLTWGVEVRSSTDPTVLFTATGLAESRFVIPGILPKPNHPPLSTLTPPQAWLDQWGTDRPYQDSVREQVTLTVTDETNGRSESFALWRTVTQIYGYDPATQTWAHQAESDETWPPSSAHGDWYSWDGPPATTSTHFRVWAEGENAHVKVGPSGVPPVPEPATLALAGFGCLSLGLLRLRRRLK